MAPKLLLHEVLHRTPAEEVTVKFQQVVDLIGEEKANELALAASAGLTEKAPNTRLRKIGAYKLVNSELATFNRLALIEAIEEDNEEYRELDEI